MAGLIRVGGEFPGKANFDWRIIPSKDDRDPAGQFGFQVEYWWNRAVKPVRLTRLIVPE
jgi:hypothetical protein